MSRGLDMPSGIFVKPALQNDDRLRNAENTIRSSTSMPMASGTEK